MKMLLQNLLIDVNPNNYLAECLDPDKGYNQSTFCDVAFNIFDCFALITKTMVDDNKALFDQPMDISKPLVVYIKKQEQYQSFATNAIIPSALKQWSTPGSSMPCPLACSRKHTINGRDFPSPKKSGTLGRPSGPKNSLIIKKCTT